MSAAALTPTEELILEVLGARYRLGEHVWPFSSRLRPALRSLQSKGMLWWKPGIVPDTYQAWLTDDGIEHVLYDGYVLPADRPDSDH